MAISSLAALGYVLSDDDGKVDMIVGALGQSGLDAFIGLRLLEWAAVKDPEVAKRVEVKLTKLGIVKPAKG